MAVSTPSELPRTYFVLDSLSRQESQDFPMPTNLAPAVVTWLLEGFRTRGLTTRRYKSIEVIIPPHASWRDPLERLLVGGVLLKSVPTVISNGVEFDFLHQGGVGDIVLSRVNTFPVEVYKSGSVRLINGSGRGSYSVFRGFQNEVIVLPPQEV